MDNYDDELKYFIKKYNIELFNFNKKNSTNHIEDELSKESIDFFNKFL